MALIKPKEITIDWQEDDGSEHCLTYRIGRYPAIESMRMAKFGQAFIASLGVEGISSNEEPADYLSKMGKYIEAVVTNEQGQVVNVPLNNLKVLEAHLPPYADLVTRLMVEVHDYNTLFMKLGSQIKTLQEAMKSIQG